MRKINNLIEKNFQKFPLLRKAYESFLQRIVFGFIIKKRGENLLEENFDYLIILDACRYDTFKENNHIKGNLSKKNSLAPHTSEWPRKTFTKKHNDLIYVSASILTSTKDKTGFAVKDYVYKLENVWEYGWNEQYQTVLPQTVKDVTLNLIKRYPSKRFIIHFIQPHQPFIKNGYSIGGVTNLEQKRNTKSAFQLAKSGKIKREEILELYRDNLILVLKEVEKLVAELDGKIIITADHGEAFGEKFIWEHVPGVYIKELIEVPWLVINKPKIKTEKKIISQVLDELKL